MSCPDVYLRQHLPDKHKQMETYPVFDRVFGHPVQYHELWNQRVRLAAGVCQNSKVGSADLPQWPMFLALMSGHETPRARRRARHALLSLLAWRRYYSILLLQMWCPRLNQPVHLHGPPRCPM